MLSKINLLGVGITTSPKEDILDAIKTYLKLTKNIKPLTVVTPNPEQIVLSQKDREFRTQLNASDIALPDGIGIVWGLKTSFGLAQDEQNLELRTQNFRRIAGTDFMLKLVELAAELKCRVGFVGGFDNAAQKTLINIQQTYPKLKGWSDQGIPNVETVISQDQTAMTDYINKLLKSIKANHTSIIFLAFGAPSQEYIMSELAKKTQGPLVIMVVGGAFDYISGYKKRAPQIVQRFGFEWLWRLINEPWRIMRQLALPRFIFLILKSRFVLK